jgi:beta-galactosidase
VMQSEKPDIHILGHWTYPADTTKTIYVIANTQSVELLLNGKRIGLNATPTDGFIFAFPKIDFRPGTLKAIGRNDEKVCCEHELKTAGPAARIKLTPILGPQAPGSAGSPGLFADGQDIALVDVEVVDANGQRCPTDDDRIDFTVTGPAVWRGGYNSGKPNSTNNLHVNTECGINRVSLRSTLTAGKIVVTATRQGLEPAQVEIESKPIQVIGGLTVSTR